MSKSTHQLLSKNKARVVTVIGINTSNGAAKVGGTVGGNLIETW